MTRTHRSLFVALLAALFVATPLVAPAEEPDHADHPHSLIRIFEHRVAPEPAKVHTDEAISWLNYSGKRARISFDQQVAKNMTCTSRGTFTMTDSRLVSGDIQATQFASLCSLKPGTYDYEVELFAGLGAGGTASPRKIPGTLIVESE